MLKIRRLMRVSLSLLFLLATCALFADEATREQFNGDWVGTISLQGRDGTVSVKLSISSNGVTQFFKDKDGWQSVDAERELYDVDRNNLVFVWINKGGVWSETQVYSLSFINNNTLDVQWLRHVNNYKNDGDNEAWNLHGSGQLTRQ